MAAVASDGMPTLNHVYIWIQEQASQHQEAVAQLAEYQAEYASELDAIKLQHQQAAAGMQSQHVSQLQAQTLEHQHSLSQVAEQHAQILGKLEQQHQQALDKMQGQLLEEQQLLAERECEHECQLERFHAMHAEAMTHEQLDCEECLRERDDAHAKDLAELTRVQEVKVMTPFPINIRAQQHQLLIARSIVSWACVLLRRIAQPLITLLRPDTSGLASTAATYSCVHAIKPYCGYCHTCPTEPFAANIY